MSQEDPSAAPRRPQQSVSQETSGPALVPTGHDRTERDELSPVGLSAQIVPPASLVVVDGKCAGQIYGLVATECVIGRSATATVPIADRSISSRHAVVRLCGRSHELMDLGSTNGTLLNGHRLNPNRPVELHPGDQIQVADVSLVYLPEGMSDLQEATQALTASPRPPPGGALVTGGLSPQPSVDEVLLQILKLSMPPEEPPKVSLDDQAERVVKLLRMAARHLPFVALVGAAAALLGVGSVVAIPPHAEAFFVIALTPKATDNPIEDRRQQAGFTFFSRVEGAFVSEKLVETTLSKLEGRNPPPALVEATAKELTLVNLDPKTAYAGGGTATYRGTFKHRSAAQALRFLKAHVENYLEVEIKKTLAVIQKQADFLDSTAKQKETELRNTEAKLRDFQSKYQGSLPQFSEGTVTSLEALRMRQSDLQGKAQGAASATAAARRELQRLAPRERSKVARASPYQAALTQARMALADAQSRGLGDGHPEVQKINGQIASLESLAVGELEKAPTEVEMAANLEVSALQHELAVKEVEEQGIAAELAQVSGQIARLEKVVTEMPDVAAQFAELSRSYDTNTATHKKLLQELETVRIQLNLERASAEKRYEVVGPPMSYPPPMRRTLAKRAAIGGAVGSLLATLIVVIRQLRIWYRGIPQRRARNLVRGAALRPAITQSLRSLPAPPNHEGSQ